MSVCLFACQSVFLFVNLSVCYSVCLPKQARKCFNDYMGLWCLIPLSFFFHGCFSFLFSCHWHDEHCMMSERKKGGAGSGGGEGRGGGNRSGKERLVACISLLLLPTITWQRMGFYFFFNLLSVMSDKGCWNGNENRECLGKDEEREKGKRDIWRNSNELIPGSRRKITSCGLFDEFPLKEPWVEEKESNVCPIKCGHLIMV